jgi:hypothetical protein
MAGPLNPPPANNSLLALVQKMAPFGREDVGYADTGETNTTGGTVETATSTYTVNVPFLPNGLGNQPPVSNGVWGLIVSGVGSQVIVGAGTVYATGSTATNSSDLQMVGEFEAVPTAQAGASVCRVKPFVISAAASGEPAAGPTSVLALVLAINITGTGSCKVNFVAAGNS